MAILYPEQIAPLVHGALGLRCEGGLLQPIRLPLADLPYHHPDLKSCFTAEAAAGVRLRLQTTSARLVLIAEHESSPWFSAAPVYDLVTAEGALLRKSAERRGDGTDQVLFEGLGDGEKMLELWLPPSAAVRIRALEIDDGASVAPTPPKGPVWVVYGSSITHCASAPGPTETWPAIAARRLGWELFSLGFNGACHLDPYVARAIAEVAADRITLKLGINVHNLQSLRERTFAPLVHGFIQTIRDRQPKTPITIVSPIFSADREHSPVTDIPVRLGIGKPWTGDLTLSQMREILRMVVTTRRECGDRAIYYLDGRELLAEADAGHLHDGLHPDSAGARLIGERFAALFGQSADHSVGR